MTRRQRAQVVELLRCAADVAANHAMDRGSALGIAAKGLDMITVPALQAIPDWKDPHWVSLLRGRGPVRDNGTPYSICGNGYEWLLLEAAQINGGKRTCSDCRGAS